MTAMYKLIFDLAAYYTLTGFYLNLFAKTPPSAVGFALLCVMAGVCLLARYRQVRTRWLRLIYLLPVLSVAVSAALWSMLHLLPAWVYTVRYLESGKTVGDYRDFRHDFLFGLRLQLLCLPGLILSNGGKATALEILPYLLVLLAVGVSCLRSLRQGGSPVQSALLTVAFLTVCLLLNVGGIPQYLLLGLRWIYNEIFVRLFQAAASVLLLVITYVVQLIANLSRLKPEHKEQIVDMESGTVQDLLGIGEELSGMQEGVQWLAIAGYVVLGAGVIAALVWLAVQLLGSLDAGKTATPVYSHKTEKIAPPQLAPRRLRPRDPRGKVRYYYMLFLRECKARGMEVRPGSTQEELTQLCVRYFPGAAPEDLGSLYAPARYSRRQQVTAQQAEEAAKAWSRLKKTKYKKAEYQ